MRGQRLLGADGERFTDELAPRDAVTLAVLDQMKRDGAGHVLLDMRELPESRFPSVFAALREAGYDPLREPIPVAPASHYVMGGIAADLEGRSSLPGLFAVGECACTGLHGANRLASNSLTECFVLGARAAAAASAEPDAGPAARASLLALRSAAGGDARRRLGPRRAPSAAPRSSERLLSDPYPLARLIARFALEREESRGSHRRLEFPEARPGPRRATTSSAQATSCAGRPGSRRAYLKNWSQAYLKVLNSCLTLLTFGHA